MKEQSSDLSRLLKEFRRSPSRTLSSKELRDCYGKDWRDAITQLQLQGYALEQILGGNGNTSYRLERDELSKMVPKAERVTISRYEDANDPTVPVRLKLSDIKAMLRTGVPPNVRDTFVGAVLNAEGET